MYYETDYLSHHGVIGMKWGVRRYQNKDGTLTAEGKKRKSGIDEKALDSKKKQTVTSETASNHISDYLDNKITESDSKKLEELWNDGNEKYIKWYDNKNGPLKEQYKKDKDVASEAYEKKRLETLFKIIKENDNKELSDAIDKHYDLENPYGLYETLLNKDKSLAKSFDTYSTTFDIMLDSYMVNKKGAMRHGHIEETDCLSHHGVIGMKWGVRRYQNKDGTLTAKGKRHRKDFAAEAREMSDDELRNKVNRLNLEKQYKDMAYEQSDRTRNLSALSEGTKKGAAVSNNLSNAQQKKGQQNGKKKGQQPQQNPKMLNSTSQLLQNASNLSKTRDRAAGDKAVRKMDLSKMSDDELRSAVNRKRMEQQYANLKQEDVKRGKRTMSNFLETSANAIVVTTSAIAVAKAAAPYVKKAIVIAGEFVEGYNAI